LTIQAASAILDSFISTWKYLIEGGMGRRDDDKTATGMAPVKLAELELVSADGVIDIAPVRAAPMTPAALVALSADETARFKAVHRFYNETIRGNLGLPGFALQLKVERADTLDDLRALRAPYLEAVKQVQGQEMARALDARLMALLEDRALA
jgi:hypothetical protein